MSEQKTNMEPMDEGQKTFTQEEVNEIVQKRLDRERRKAEPDNDIIEERNQLASEVERLTKALEKAKIDGALQVAFIKAKAIDPEYLTYKLQQEGVLKLDEKGNIPDIDNKLKDMKTTMPNFFEVEPIKHILEKKLDKSPCLDYSDPDIGLAFKPPEVS